MLAEHDTVYEHLHITTSTLSLKHSGKKWLKIIPKMEGGKIDHSFQKVFVSLLHWSLREIRVALPE